MQIHFTTPLGAHISIECNPNEYWETLRQCGAKGWVSGNPLAYGGLKLPYANHERFDWRLIGARAGKITQNGNIELGVWFRGDFFKRRTLEASESKKMKLPAAIKYSRGARSHDPPEIVEKSGEFEYVTLVVFRSGGHIAHYDIPDNPKE
jgi:hypothetical protein